MLSRITPVLLTHDEEANVGRTLAALSWAARVVVVDSGSTDATRAIVERHRNAVFFSRPMGVLADQWTYALRETGIDTEWVLALDADYVLTPALVEELRCLAPPGPGVDGFRARFRYCVEGRPLRGSLYPPVTVLYRREGAAYEQEGHAQRVRVAGAVRWLEGTILHDDRKPLARFLASQARYMREEAALVRAQPFGALRWSGRVRKLRALAPFAVVVQCLLVKGLVLDGRAGLVYTLQRLCAEAILSLYLLQGDLAGGGGAPGGSGA